MSEHQGEIRGAPLIRARGRSSIRLCFLSALLSVPVVLWSAAPVSARQQGGEADTTQVISLAPIEVSVLRTPVLQTQAPLAVAALTGTELHQGRAGFFLAEALQGLPGVQVQNRFNPAVGERVAIRGFGARAQFGLRSIRVIVDGIPATLPDGQSSLDHLDIGSLGRVEVIRGPASALYGNAAGGVLSFTTEAPSSAPYDVDVTGVTGSDGLWRGQATASGTLSGDTGYLVNLSGETWNGFRNISPTSARRDTLGTRYGEADRYGVNARVTKPVAGGELAFTGNVVNLSAQNPGSKGDDFSEAAYREINDIYLRFRTGKDLTQQQAGVRWNGPLGGGLDGDFSAYGLHRTISNPIPADSVELHRNGGGLRGQLGTTVDTGFGDLVLRGGVEYDLQRDDRAEWATSFPTGMTAPNPYLDQKEDVTGVGVFLQSTLELPGGAVGLAGLRYDHTDFTVHDRVPVTPENPDDSGSRTMDAWSPSIGVSIPTGDNLSVFGSVGTVFETPTTTELANSPDVVGGFNPNLQPMRGTSFEAGLRGFVGSVAAFEVNAYQTNLRHELVPYEIAGTEGVTYYKNSGKSRHRGIEATLSIVPEGTVLRGDFTYTLTDARFVEYELGAEDLSGNRVPGVAPQRFQTTLRLEPRSWFGEVDGTYVDNVPVNDQNTASAPSYFLVDLRAGLNEISVGRMRVSPWVAVLNVFGEDYISSVAVNAFGNRYYEPGPDASFQIGLQTSFSGGN